MATSSYLLGRAAAAYAVGHREYDRNNNNNNNTTMDGSGAVPPPSDDNIGPALIVSSSVLMGAVVVTTVLRLLVRARNRMLGWDDYTVLVVAVLAAARLGCQAAQVRHGNGRHEVYLDDGDYAAAIRYGWYALLLFFVAICLLKISICLLLLRIKNERWLRWLIYATMAGLVVTNGGVVVILLAECRPVDTYWTDMAQCWNPRVRVFSIYVTIGYSILTDLLCSFLPLVVIWNVRIPLRSKLLVCGLMSLGLLATACGIGRAVSLSLKTVDFTWAFCITEIWANFELLLGAVAANLALARSIFIFLFEDDTAANGGAGANGGNGGGVVVVGGGGGGGGGVTGGITGSNSNKGLNGLLHGGPLRRLSRYGYHGLRFSLFGRVRLPSWQRRSRRHSQAAMGGGGGIVGGGGNGGILGPRHVFRRQASASPSRHDTGLSSFFPSWPRSGSSSQKTASSSDATDARTVINAGAGWGRRLVDHVLCLVPERFAFWDRAGGAQQRTDSEKGIVPAAGAAAAGPAFAASAPGRGKGGRLSGMGGLAGLDVDTTDILLPPNLHHGSGRRGSATSTSAVVIVGGRDRDRDRTRDRARDNSWRSSLYYHHHLSKNYPHPYGSGSGSGSSNKNHNANRWSAAASAAASDDSSLPAGAGVIKKRTEFWISEEEIDQDEEAMEDEGENGDEKGRGGGGRGNHARAYGQREEEEEEYYLAPDPHEEDATNTSNIPDGGHNDDDHHHHHHHNNHRDRAGSTASTAAGSAAGALSLSDTATTATAVEDVDDETYRHHHHHHHLRRRDSDDDDDLELGLHPPPRTHLS
ncbi:hypothetical protein SPI_02046 [Niveomyces insectorum RCEF 264]|uniref:Rhodopsin domain-containing protein n=1 Tax=Niveomyces insectorum RCEF 264 TaxID=1081102 RepID=A0A167XQF0_9HYPO|nr:hypothetical protein SPI_02046 [Niveomyces insectorum RCEF 264]